MLTYIHTADEPLKKNEKIIFIDRDGVINVDLIGDYIKNWKEFRFEEGALEALQLLSRHGYHIVVISNQAGIGDKIFPKSSLEDIHKNMVVFLKEQGVKIYSAFYCLHGKEEGCHCRKPEIGLFLEAEKYMTFRKADTFFIGDKKSDIEAGKRFGLKTAFVRTGHGKYEEAMLSENLVPDIKANNLLDAVKELLLK